MIGTTVENELYQVSITIPYACSAVDHVMIIIDREKDASESASGPGAEQTAQPPKRPRINRNRYQSSSYAIAKKLLPTDSQAGDKTRSGRKD